MDLLFLILFIFDGMIVGKIISLICTYLFGDKPASRLIKLLLSIFGGVIYSVVCFNIGYGDNDISIGLGLVIFLAPVVVLLVLWILNYMFDNQENGSGKNNKNE